MEIKQNSVVAMEYSVKDKENNELIDTNKGGKPLEFLYGSGQVIAGLEKALLQKSTGDSLEVEIAPEDAYGVYRSDFLQEVPRDQFEGIELKEGMTLFGQGEDGRTVQVIVRDFNNEMVMIDYNHPLAGKTLVFDIVILDVREATEQEILTGMSGGGCGCRSGCGCGHGHEDGEHGDKHSCDGSGTCGHHK